MTTEARAPHPAPAQPPVAAAATAPARPALLGALYATAAYGSWGLLPVYWKALANVPAPEILAHRVLWSFAFTALLLALFGGWRGVRSALGERRTLLILAATSALIASNWLLFIWSVQQGHVLASSLGYFLNPLVNVALGVLFLHERLRPLQSVAVALAGAGVLQLAFSAGGVPWISLALATSFALYGLLRKLAPMPSLVSLFAETALLAPLALGFCVMLAARGRGSFLAGDASTTTLLLVAGPLTALPLLWFASAARRLRLATLGLFQYLAPSGHFALAVLLYAEPFERRHAITFGCIWLALLLYSLDAARALRAPPEPAA